MAQLEQITAFLSSVRGTDKVFMLTQYASKIIIWGLQKRDPQSTLATRVANLSGPISDTRILLRYYGLVPLIQWILYSEKVNPPPTKTLVWLNRAQNLSNLLYYPLEHLYWLAAHKVIPMQDATRDKIGMWSCRFWAAYVVLYFAQLYKENELLSKQAMQLDMKRKKDGVDSKDGSFVVQSAYEKEAAIIKHEKFKLRLNTLINAAYFPLTVHWSLPSSPLTDVGVGVFGTIAAVAQLYMAYSTA